MNRSKAQLSILAALALAAASQASITSFSEHANATSYQYDGGSYYLFDQVTSGPFNFSSPFTRTFPADGTVMGSENTSTLNFDATSSTYVHRTASVDLQCDMIRGGLNSAEAGAYMYDEWVFTTDSTMDATVTSFATVSHAFGGAFAGSILYIDQQLTLIPDDRTYTFSLAAGNHVMYFEGFVYANSAPGAAAMGTNYDMQLGTVPEPASLSILSVAAIALRRRKAKVS